MDMKFGLTLMLANGEKQNMGTRAFQVCPRQDELILNTEPDDTGMAYRVLGVMHWSQPGPYDLAGIILVEATGETFDIEEYLVR